MEITLKNKLEAIDQLNLFLKDLGTKYNIPKPALAELDLALGELVGNIIKYACKGKEDSDCLIHLNCQIDEGKMTCVLTDRSFAFNPLEYKSENSNLSLKDRPIGGLGIMIARKSVDSISYERKNETNVLKMIKIFKN